MQAARSVTLFSATLSPRHFYSDLLGMPADTAWLEVAAPFRAEQLEVRIASQVSTRYQQRQASLAPIVELIARQYERMPGNYLAFFSSFEYLQQVAGLLAERHAQIPLWVQNRAWTRRPAVAFSTVLWRMAVGWALRCWVVHSGRGWTCRAHG